MMVPIHTYYIHGFSMFTASKQIHELVSREILHMVPKCMLISEIQIYEELHVIHSVDVIIFKQDTHPRGSVALQISK